MRPISDTIFSIDISAAFLKGMTYEKIAKITGAPLRSVQFDVPPRDAWLLQKLPGMSDFNYHTEVLDLIKALWGLKDAPRAFGLKLVETLCDNGFTQGIVDPQVWRKFSKEGLEQQHIGRIGDQVSLSTSELAADSETAGAESAKRSDKVGE